MEDFPKFLVIIYLHAHTSCRELDCGNHLCERLCHAGRCFSCSLLPANVTHCPCGAQTVDSLLPENSPRLSCLDPVPTCDNICGKRLSCSAPGNCCAKYILSFARFYTVYFFLTKVVLGFHPFSTNNYSADHKQLNSRSHLTSEHAVGARELPTCTLYLRGGYSMACTSMAGTSMA